MECDELHTAPRLTGGARQEQLPAVFARLGQSAVNNILPSTPNAYTNT